MTPNLNENLQPDSIICIESEGHLRVELIKQKVDNLVTLMGYLLVAQLKATFDMAVFGDGQHWSDIERFTDGKWHNTNNSREATECGTVGCGVGQGPYAGVPKEVGETWPEYGARCFFNNINDMIYKFCFSDEWKNYDNSPIGCGLRIQHVLHYGIPAGIDQEFPNYAKLIALYSKGHDLRLKK